MTSICQKTRKLNIFLWATTLFDEKHTYIKGFFLSLLIKADSVNIMKEQKVEYICTFLASRPRYKLVICQANPFADIPSLNLGYSLAKDIAKISDVTSISYEVPGLVDNLINRATTKIQEVGECVIIENVGILFEPSLGVIPCDVIAKHAKNKTVILIWNGEYHKQKLRYNDNLDYTIDLSNINHIAL